VIRTIQAAPEPKPLITVLEERRPTTFVIVPPLTKEASQRETNRSTIMQTSMNVKPDVLTAAGCVFNKKPQKCSSQRFTLRPKSTFKVEMHMSRNHDLSPVMDV
jgi:hypothetical protein